MQVYAAEVENEEELEEPDESDVEPLSEEGEENEYIPEVEYAAVPMTISYVADGMKINLTITAGFNIKAYLNADGTIDFVKLYKDMKKAQ